MLRLICDRPSGVCTDANGQATDSDIVLERDGEPGAARYHVVLPPGPPAPAQLPMQRLAEAETFF
eukprot:COSAG02_NODE_4478_length_5321_cov_7.801226_7_plen_65_part_00